MTPGKAARARHRKGAAVQAQALHRRGAELYGLGQTAEAIECLRQAIEEAPADAAIPSDLARMLHSLNRFDEAVAAYRKGLERNPDRPEEWRNLGSAEFSRGAYAAAAAAYEQAVRLGPADARSLAAWGLSLEQAGDKEAALAVYRRAAAADPASEDLALLAPNLLMDLRRYREAAGSYAEAAARLNSAAVHHNLGNALQKCTDLAGALSSYRKALALDPDYVPTLCNLGDLFRLMGRQEEAEQALLRALEREPRPAAALNNLAVLRRAAGETAEAIALAAESLRLEPGNPDTLLSLAVGLQIEGRYSEALDCVCQALQSHSDLAPGFANLAGLLGDMGETREAVSAIEQAMRLAPDEAVWHSNFLYYLQTLPGLDAATVFSAHRQFETQRARGLARLPHENRPDPERRLRAGYVSADFYGHSVSYFLLPLLEATSREEFEIFCYSNGGRTDAVTGRYREACEGRWRDLRGLSDDEAAEQIRADGIDILVDVSGHTGGNRLLLFARKPAPVQVTYLGYPGTTGLTAIDYRLTDGWADPEGWTEAFHSEQLWRLAGGFLAYEPPPAPDVAPPPSASSGAVTFGCFNTLAKLSPLTLELWARILERLPASRLLLKAKALADAGVRERLLARLAAAGVPAGRVELRGHAGSLAGHLNTYAEVDIALDPFPYHGTTTTCEALWMGVPVVTLAGRTHVSRAGLSLETRCGLEAFVAGSPEEYLEKAVAAARPEVLAPLRQSMRDRLVEGGLTDGQRLAREAGSAYRAMWRRWCASGNEQETERWHSRQRS